LNTTGFWQVNRRPTSVLPFLLLASSWAPMMDFKKSSSPPSTEFILKLGKNIDTI